MSLQSHIKQIQAKASPSKTFADLSKGIIIAFDGAHGVSDTVCKKLEAGEIIHISERLSQQGVAITDVAAIEYFRAIAGDDLETIQTICTETGDDALIDAADKYLAARDDSTVYEGDMFLVVSF